MTTTIETKLCELRRILREMKSALVCFSGGLDSGFLLTIAHEQLGKSAVAFTAIGPSIPEFEQQHARELAVQIGALHVVVDAGELSLPAYVSNCPDRCFHCKTAHLAAARKCCDERGLMHVVDGTNLDDFGDFRPGMEAAKNAGVLSPLVDAGFGKDDIREAANLMGLGFAGMHASACLASRIPYGTQITPQRLSQVADLEAAVRALGFRVVRVRHHDTIARIEVGVDELPRAVEPECRVRIVDAAMRVGFRYATLDLGGYRMGSHNEVLEGRKLPVAMK